MIWTDLTQKAYRIACEAHCGQSDKGGGPYIIHPCTLAAQMSTEESTTVALLHDVLEDSDITPENLAAQGIPVDIIQSVVLLSRNYWPDLTYMEYVQNLRKDSVAVTVKSVDLRHNMDLSRLGHTPTEKDMSRYQRYEKALQILEGVGTKSFPIADHVRKGSVVITRDALDVGIVGEAVDGKPTRIYGCPCCGGSEYGGISSVIWYDTGIYMSMDAWKQIGSRTKDAKGFRQYWLDRLDLGK